MNDELIQSGNLIPERGIGDERKAANDSAEAGGESNECGIEAERLGVVRVKEIGKLRSDSVWAKLTEEQRETLDGWLFDERVSPKLVLGWVQDDFGVQTSLTSLWNYHKRRVRERTDEKLEQALVEAKLTAGRLEDGAVKKAATQLVEERILRMLVAESADLETTEKIVKMLTRLQSVEIQEKRLEFAREGKKLRMAEKCLNAEAGAVMIRIEQEPIGAQEAVPGNGEEAAGPRQSA